MSYELEQERLEQAEKEERSQQYPGRAVAIDPGLIAAASNAINDTAPKMTDLERAINISPLTTSTSPFLQPRTA